MKRDVFHAIADPTRREILNLLAHQPRTVNEIAAHFRTSRPAISRHLRILRESGLLLVARQGRHRYCRSRFGKLDEVSAWLDRYREMWDRRFDRMDGLLAEK